MATNRCRSNPYSTFATLHISPRTLLSRSHTFSKSKKLAKISFAMQILSEFLKTCFRVKIWSVVLRPGENHTSHSPTLDKYLCFLVRLCNCANVYLTLHDTETINEITKLWHNIVHIINSSYCVTENWWVASRQTLYSMLRFTLICWFTPQKFHISWGIPFILKSFSWRSITFLGKTLF